MITEISNKIAIPPITPPTIAGILDGIHLEALDPDPAVEVGSKKVEVVRVNVPVLGEATAVVEVGKVVGGTIVVVDKK
ncbi:hypothetical protein FRC03_011243 [Tulasnella sp. 419]|nr:hypothetical protein FRC03_011243 [Tulasnella sp. 419]